MSTFEQMQHRNSLNKASVGSDDYIRILAREGDRFRIESHGITKTVDLAEIMQMIRFGYAISNISFLKPYMRY